jgi:hypothetical protein
MQVQFHKDEAGAVKVAYDKNRRAPGLLRTFISDHRKNGEERPGMKNLAADFAWRRSVKMTDIKKDPTFRNAIAGYLGKPESTLVFRFNRYCGCPGCPCSPGILIQQKDKSWYNSTAPEIWLDIFDDDQNIAEVLFKEEEERRIRREAYEAQKKLKAEAEEAERKSAV